MNAVRSRPVQRAWRNLPVCPVGTRGRILTRRVSSSSHAAAEAQVRGAPGEGRDPMWDIISLPKITRRNPALSWALPSPPAAGPTADTTDKVYLHPNSTPPAISRLLRAIDSRSPEAIWHHFSLLTPSERARLSPQHLSHILLSLRPKKHLPIASRAYLDHYHPSYSPSLSSIPLARLPKRQHAINWLLSRVAAVLAEYHANNIPLGTAEYAHLLDVARAKEDVRMARELWAEMDARGVQKDTKCYNTYIAALCGTMSTEGTWKTNARTVGVRARRYSGMRGGEAQEKVGDVGVAALRIWEVMLKDGCVPDMATFEFVLGAVARMGNLPVMKALVWRAWGVDISAPSFDTRPNPTQIQETEPDISTSTMNAKHSPPGQFTSNRPPPPPPSEPPPLYIRPTPQTLTSLAAIISRLSHPSLAIRLVNYLSITYNLTIPTATWQHLLVWTYVYTRPPARTRVLPESSMTKLWQVMRAPPYTVEPEIEMYDLIIRHHLRGHRYKWAKQLITEALSPGGAWDRLNKQFEATRRRVEREVGWGVNRSHAVQERRKGLPQLHRTTPLTTKLAALDLEIWRARSLISRWIQLLIYAQRVDDAKEYRRREVPRLINKYAAEFLPGQVGYKIEGSGYVTIRVSEGVLGVYPPKPYQHLIEPRKELEVVRVSEERWMYGEEEGLEEKEEEKEEEGKEKEEEEKEEEGKEKEEEEKEEKGKEKEEEKEKEKEDKEREKEEKKEKEEEEEEEEEEEKEEEEEEEEREEEEEEGKEEEKEEEKEEKEEEEEEKEEEEDEEEKEEEKEDEEEKEEEEEDEEEEEEEEKEEKEEEEEEGKERIDLVPRISSGVERRFLTVHRQRESVRWRWKNRGVKYGEWRGEGSGYAKGEGEEAQGGEGVLGLDRTRLGPPERSVRLGFVRRG